MLAALGLLLAASTAFAGEAAIAQRLTCGTFEPQFHEDGPRCEGAYCWGDDGRPLPPEPAEVLTLVTQSGFFKLHYTLSGVGAVPLTDDDANGVPDYVDHFATAFDDGLAALRALGFRDPLPDAHGGDERLDVYFNWAGGNGGTAYWDEHSPNTRPEYPGAYPVFIAINPVQHAAADEVLPGWMGDLLIRQVAIHELHHAVQLGYGDPGESWVLEGMSVMIERSCSSCRAGFRSSPTFATTIAIGTPRRRCCKRALRVTGMQTACFTPRCCKTSMARPAA